MHLSLPALPSLLTIITPLITLTLPPPTTAWAFAYTNQTGSTRFIHGYESDLRKCTVANIAKGKLVDYDSQGDRVCVSIYRDETCTDSAGYACHTHVHNASANFAAYSIYPREEEAAGGGLSGGAIAGIVVGVVAACAGAGAEGSKRGSGESSARGDSAHGDGDGDGDGDVGGRDSGFERPSELMGDAGLSEMSDSHRVVELGDSGRVERHPQMKVAELG
ncbi:hypothetical protein P168DRAFT_326102 [Aspergillus campestris IBT 28561]|uniref:Uncharacterized protein n=1 Tax=Aspergillus campestris (strain IBT 28561) TaxID=1392248 RepID=A0A2I1D7E5_ASPC2|nr:uncharacterized protein P168DRAFT_326102 [Aspergillus campestris IBT 28561]PKY05787.1 hypothetical protein P168DRAFT_326102 [Aspergillus campestris IBT 28561]